MPLLDFFRNRRLERENQSLLQRVSALEARSPAVVVSAAAQWASSMALMPGRRDAALLRNVADASPIVRAAINAKKRHVSQLEYDVRGDNDVIEKSLQKILARPYPGGTWRKFIGQVIEDLLVLDAGAIYIWPTRSGDLYGLLPIDSNTITRTPNLQGITLPPPAIAYEQYIAGELKAQLTDNDLIFLEMNPRTWSLSGLSPVEVVLLAVGVMLKRMIGSGEAFDDGNIPAFFGEVPEGWSPDQIKIWQEYWDAMTAGQPHKGMWGPKGANATFPPQQAFDVAFDEWLVKVVCAVMEIQPQELGFTADVNRSTGVSQELIAQRRSVRPIALLLKEGIDHAFAATGYEGYELNWPSLDSRDREEIRQDARTFIPLKIWTPNDARREMGDDPVEWGDVPVETNSNVGKPLPPEQDVNRGLKRAKPKALKVTALDDHAEALKVETELRTAIGQAFDQQRMVIERLMQGVEVPADLNILDDEAVDKWAAREMADRLGKRKIKRAAGDANDDDWESLLTPTFMDALKELATYGAQAGANALSASVNVDWSLANPDVARWARKYSSLLVTKINDTTWRSLKDSLAEWVMAKENYDQLVARFATILGDPKRADLVASTEATRAYAQGNRIVWQKCEEEYGITVMRMWMTAEDEIVCPVCGGLNGNVAGLDEPFDLDGVEYDGPPAHPRCLPGNARVTSIGRIAATSERHYDGDLIVIRTASGKQLSVTPNHPILTPRGWVGAGALQIGNHVIGSRGVEWSATGFNLDNQNVPTRIEEIAEAFRDALQVLATPVPVSAEDFHGDGKGSKVAVIRTNGLLRDGDNTTLGEPFSESAFIARDVDVIDDFNSACFSHLPFKRLGHAALGSVSGLREPLPLFGTGLGHAEIHRLGTAPDRNATLDEALSDGTARDADLAFQILNGAAGEVFADEVVNIEIQAFHGMVFNLETTSGAYIAEGVVTHNCRCDVAPVV